MIDDMELCLKLARRQRITDMTMVWVCTAVSNVQLYLTCLILFHDPSCTSYLLMQDDVTALI